MKSASALASKILAGDVRAAAQLMRDIDDRIPSAQDVLRALFPHTGRARIIGLTGTPGAGKSTLADRLITHLRKAGQTVGVLAVDPTSPFTGGAILGDRIRMQQHATDAGVFIRSLATRGALGGLSRAASDCVRVLDAMGKNVILVETVGVGQDEVDIAQLAHTTIVAVVPGLGDDIQAIKAGILEVADLFVVNKADRDGGDRTIHDLRAMLELRRVTALTPPTWEPDIVRAVATADEGVAELLAAIARHESHLHQTGEWRGREIRRAKTELVALLSERLLRAGLEKLEAQRGQLDEIAGRIADRVTDPYSIAEEVAAL